MKFSAEHIIVKSPHVKAALVFGKGRPFNGVLIEPTSYDEVDSLGLEKFRNLIWLVFDLLECLGRGLMIVPGQK